MPSEENKLGQCHACQGTISKKAKSCPHCGEKKPYKQSYKENKIIASISGIISIGLVIWFLSSIEKTSNDTHSIPGAAPEAEAREMCEDAIRAHANNPSTVNIHHLSGYGTNIDAVGTRRITQTFSVKNSFGLERTYDAYCSVTSEGDFDINIVEQGR